MADVAQVAGVSHQTVSRVLNGHPSVRPQTRARVLAAIESLGYRRNSAARALVTSRSATIGVVTTGSPLYGPTSTLFAIERAARDAGYFVSVAALASYDGEAMRTVLEHLMSQGVEGIVVIAPQDDVAAAVDSFSSPVPVVLVAAREGAGTGLEVAVDQRAGARLATEHLVSLGHERIMHLSGPDDWFDARERVLGWRDAMADAGLGTAGLLAAGDWSAERGYRSGLGLADRTGAARPTAVFAGNDQLALGLLRAFWERGVRVPDDVSVVGFDDVEGAAYLVPALTTVRQPFDELGRECLDVLVAALGDVAVARDVAIAPRLVVRSSTAPPTG
ncbi:LacI family transcriptional regulator [Cellulomonas sp. PhB143]|nr:LacI family DNA-binding transcriptional regulator [Cellulomonas sp. PhB143]ROS76669.1 LacI family transcriptional regulator [Cellulomonas sp. PhB143]